MKELIFCPYNPVTEVYHYSSWVLYNRGWTKSKKLKQNKTEPSFLKEEGKSFQETLSLQN